MHTATISPPLHGLGIRIVNRPDLENVRRLDRAPMPMIADMQRSGIRVDPGALISLNTKLTTQMGELDRHVEGLTGVKVNLGSGDQLAWLLFKHLKLKQNGREKWTRSKKRLAADSDVLKAMVSQHPAIRPILDWKEREKLRSTYTLSLAAKRDSESRIHTDFGTITAETGRLTSTDPNLQNIPVRTKLGQEIRAAFVSRPGNVMGSVDASQIEMRQNAHDAQCPALMDIFWSFQDVYWATAELMYKRVFSEDERKNGIVESGAAEGLSYKAWFRFNAKTTALMTAYDTSPGGLYDQFLITSPEAWQAASQEEGEAACALIIKEYFTVFKEILTRRAVHHRRAFKYMMAWDMWGRIRWIPQVKSVLRWVVSEGLRAAGNLAGQGGAAGIMKLWMALVQRDLVEAKYGRHGLEVLVQVHDELVVEGKRNVVQDFLEDAADILCNMFVSSQYQEYYSVPLGADFKVGEKWSDLKD